LKDGELIVDNFAGGDIDAPPEAVKLSVIIG